MNIDLVYYFRNVNNFYYLNGPEKVNGNIVNNSPAYQLSSANDVVTRINQMIASLAPDITNVGIVTSELYIGDIQVNTYRGELKVGSDVPDYTDILTSINTNLNIIGNNLKISSDNKSVVGCLESIFDCLNTAPITSSSSNKKLSSYSRFLVALSSFGLGNTDSVIADNSNLKSIFRQLRQSVSPNASITDVISSLNTNIHNDLTNINTTTENKDNVLIIDGQQTFKIRNSDEEI